jgi:hypothetical protein
MLLMSTKYGNIITMSPLPEDIRQLLVDPTRELERLQEAEMKRMLGRAVLEAAQHEEEIESDILASFTNEEVMTYYDNSPENPKPSPATLLGEARTKFDDNVQRLFGKIGGYELGHAELGVLSLLQFPDRVADPDNASYIQLDISAGENNTVDIKKVRKVQFKRMSPESLPVTDDDEDAVVAALKKIEEINLEIALNGSTEI